MRELIQETAGFEKVSYQMAQRWHDEYILNQHKYAKKRGVKPNAEFEAAVINMQHR